MENTNTSILDFLFNTEDEKSKEYIKKIDFIYSMAIERMKRSIDKNDVRLSIKADRYLLSSQQKRAENGRNLDTTRKKVMILGVLNMDDSMKNFFMDPENPERKSISLGPIDHNESKCYFFLIKLNDLFAHFMNIINSSDIDFIKNMKTVYEKMKLISEADIVD